MQPSQAQSISRDDLNRVMEHIEENHSEMPEQIYILLCNILRNEYNRNNNIRMDQMFHMQSHGNNRVIVSLAETNRILATTIAKQMETIQQTTSQLTTN